MPVSVLLDLFTCLKNEPYVIFLAFPSNDGTVVSVFAMLKMSLSLIVLDLQNSLALINKEENHC